MYTRALGAKFSGPSTKRHGPVTAFDNMYYVTLVVVI